MKRLPSPFLVSGRAAINDYQSGNYASAALNAGLTVLDIATLGAAGTAVKADVKAGVKVASAGLAKAFGKVALKEGAAVLKTEGAQAVKAVAQNVLGGLCFFGGTPVATEHGPKPIEDIRAGERVWSCDLVTGDWTLCRVAETYQFEHVGARISVFTGGDRIDSTYHHPYWVVSGVDLDNRPCPDHVASAEVQNCTVEGRWVDAGDVRVGDVVLSRDGRHLAVDDIQVSEVVERVYNLAVDGLRNYAVGCEQVMVHNNCAQPAKALAISEIVRDSKGKIHGVLPSFVPSGTPIGILQDAASELGKSIATRQKELVRLGEEAGHRTRIGLELNLLTQILKALSGS